MKRGEVYQYLGVFLDYSIDGKVQIRMDAYIDGILKTLPENMSGESATPAGDHLFTINPDTVLLSASESDSYHHYVAKLVCLCKRARPNKQTAATSQSIVKPALPMLRTFYYCSGGQ